MTGNGILCEAGAGRVRLDPRSADPAGINFVSHAHADHLPSRNGGTILSSPETRRIAGLRGFEMDNHTDSAEEFTLVDSGHILGSKGLLFEDVFYTGDICTRDRGFLRGARIPRCGTLITECTFGLPGFRFPAIGHVRRLADERIAELYARGVPVILMGYQLGKAQTITELFGHWEPLYLHDSVRQMNSLHREMGVPLPDRMGHSEAERRGLLRRRPWVMVAPLMANKSAFVQEMKSKYGAVTMGFSGWAQSREFQAGGKNGRGGRRARDGSPAPSPPGTACRDAGAFVSRMTDHSFPISDHCDFGELVQAVRRSGAERVYTVHGFTGEFAASLREMEGIDARPLAAAPRAP